MFDHKPFGRVWIVLRAGRVKRPRVSLGEPPGRASGEAKRPTLSWAEYRDQPLEILYDKLRLVAA